MASPHVDLAIVGAQKAATTSLQNYLSQHPLICNQLPVEFDFFINKKLLEKGWDYSFKRLFPEFGYFLGKKSGGTKVTSPITFDSGANLSLARFRLREYFWFPEILFSNIFFICSQFGNFINKSLIIFGCFIIYFNFVCTVH